MKSFSFLSCLAAVILLLSCGAESGEQASSPSTTGSGTSEKKVDLSQNGRLPMVDFVELLGKTSNAQLIDVRTPNEFGQGALPNSTNINYHGDNFDQELEKLNRDQPVFIYCQSGGRSGKTYFKLKKMGFPDVYEMRGGYLAWKKEFGDQAN